MRRLRLRTNVILAIGIPIIVLGIAGTLHARVTLRNASAAELELRGLSIARDLEVDATEASLTNDLFMLHRTFAGLLAADPDVRYVMMLDREGQVRLSTLGRSLPEGLRAANSAGAGAVHSFVALDTTEGRILDLAYPLQSQTGTIRLGMSERRLATQVDALTTDLAGLTAAALGVALLASYAVAVVLTRPLAQLTEVARAIGRGESMDHRDLYGHPDVGELAVAFDDMTARLREKEVERSGLLARLIDVQEEERGRLARDLHDEAGQALSSLIMGLGRIERVAASPGVTPVIAEVRAEANEVLDLMRHLSRELRPTTLDDLGLVPALRSHIEECARKSAIDVRFSAEQLDGARLNPELETALYRIALEALTNILRHSAARNASVVLSRRDDRVVMVVEDDGIGFDADRLRAAPEVGGRLGLLGMEERAQLVGGSVMIESGRGTGTAVFVEVPVETRL